MTYQNRIKILFIANSLVRRGAEQQLFSFIKKLPPNFSISIFRFSTSDNEYPELFNHPSVGIYSSKHPGKYSLLKLKELYTCLHRQKYDAIVTLGLGPALFFGRLFALFTGTKIIYSFLNTLENFHKLPKLSGDYFDIMNKWLNLFIPVLRVNSTFRFLPNSKKLSNMVRGLVNGYPVHTICNGIPTDEIRKLSKLTPDKKTKRLIDQIKERPTIVQVGALDENKNQQFSLNLIHELKDEMPELCLLIIGEGHKWSELIDFVSANSLENQVIFTGKMKRLECLYHMLKADLLVMTSQSESFPNVILEAQALSLPVITFDVGAAHEIVKQGITGYIIKREDKQDFSKKLKKLLRDKSLARKMGKMGQDRALKLFNMDKKVNRFMLMLYKDLCIIKQTI